MPKGFYLYKEGDFGNFFYIVKEGELELTYTTGENKKIKTGDSFGELALIQKNQRSSTVTTLTDIEIYCLEGEIFKEIMLKNNNKNLKERIKLLNFHPIFKFFSANQIHEIAVNMLKCEFEKGEIIEENQIKDALFLIIEGSFFYSPIDKNNFSQKKNTKNGYFLKDYFGLSGLIYPNKKHNCNIISESYSKCFKLTKCVLFNVLGEDFLKKIFQNLTKNAIGRIKILKLLSNEEYFLKIFPIFKLRVYNKNEVVYDLSEEGKYLGTSYGTFGAKRGELDGGSVSGNMSVSGGGVDHRGSHHFSSPHHIDQKFVILLEGNLMNVKFLKF